MGEAEMDPESGRGAGVGVGMAGALLSLLGTADGVSVLQVYWWAFVVQGAISAAIFGFSFLDSSTDGNVFRRFARLWFFIALAAVGWAYVWTETRFSWVPVTVLAMLLFMECYVLFTKVDIKEIDKGIGTFWYTVWMKIKGLFYGLITALSLIAGSYAGVGVYQHQRTFLNVLMICALIAGALVMFYIVVRLNESIKFDAQKRELEKQAKKPRKRR